MLVEADTPRVISITAHYAFENTARSMGLDPSDLWVGGYVDYEWGRLKCILDEYLINPSNLNVLEFGANVGASAIVYSNLGANVTAIDVCDDYVALAKLNAKQYGCNDIVFHQITDTRQLPFDDSCFDLVNCNSVLEYVDSKHLNEVIHELDRVLKPGGRVLITGTSSRMWPKEVHSEKWLVNYMPRFLDRFIGAPGGLQRGISPWVVRNGFGSSYTNLDLMDKGEAYLRSRLRIYPSNGFYYRVLVKFANILRIGPGLLTSNFSCLLQKQLN